MPKMLKVTLCLLLMSLFPVSGIPQTGKQSIFKCVNGLVSFTSEAPLETIFAESKELRGIIDTSKNTFAFSVAMVTFEGFNSPLQKEHFNENYMESTMYPTATFSGKIIESIDYLQLGIVEIRAKGVLNIHGVKQERIIKGTIEVGDNRLKIHSEFSITMIDYNIRTPKIVHQKIAPEISLKIDAVLIPTPY